MTLSPGSNKRTLEAFMKRMSWMVAVGLLVSPIVSEASNTWSRDPGYSYQLNIPYTLRQIKDLPLYEAEPAPTPTKPVDPYIKTVMEAAHHIFVQRTAYSITLGARVDW
jgi:hypothetical protein